MKNSTHFIHSRRKSKQSGLVDVISDSFVLKSRSEKLVKRDIRETRRQGWMTLLALLVIAFAVYIGFSPLFELVEGGVAARVLGSSFGAIFVIILTMFLLN